MIEYLLLNLRKGHLVLMKGNVQKAAAFFSNGLIYGLNGIYLIMPLFLSKYFDSIQSGYLLAIRPFLLCIAPLFWGEITDRAKNKNNIMILLVAGATLAICALKINTGFIFVTAMLVLYSFFQAPFGSLIDIPEGSCSGCCQAVILSPA